MAVLSKGYDPNQPRDDGGKWSSGGSGGASSSRRVPDPNGQYRLIVNEEGGGAGTFVGHWDGSTFASNEDSPTSHWGKLVSPAEAAKAVHSNLSEMDADTQDAMSFFLEKDGERYAWNKQAKRWAKG